MRDEYPNQAVELPDDTPEESEANSSDDVQRKHNQMRHALRALSDSKDLYTIDEIAIATGHARKTIERWLKKGWVRSIKVGRSVFIENSELENILITNGQPWLKTDSEERAQLPQLSKAEIAISGERGVVPDQKYTLSQSARLAGVQRIQSISDWLRSRWLYKSTVNRGIWGRDIIAFVYYQRFGKEARLADRYLQREQQAQLDEEEKKAVENENNHDPAPPLSPRLTLEELVVKFIHENDIQPEKEYRIFDLMELFFAARSTVTHWKQARPLAIYQNPRTRNVHLRVRFNCIS
jgi:excisionase family DNA binding protein